MISWTITQYPSPDPVTGQNPPYGVQTTLYWNSVADFQAAMADEGSKVTGADVARFSNVWPVIWTGEVAAQEARDAIEKDMKEFTYGEAGL
jgi:hypothetical protein